MSESERSTVSDASDSESSATGRRNREEPKRIVEYFFLVGLGEQPQRLTLNFESEAEKVSAKPEEQAPNQRETGGLASRCDGGGSNDPFIVRYEGEILQTLPRKDWPDFRLNESLWMFAFPEGVQLAEFQALPAPKNKKQRHKQFASKLWARHIIPPEEFFSFTTADDDGKKTYVAVLRFWEQLSPNVDHNHLHGDKKILAKDSVYSQAAICMVSQVPAIAVMRESLRYVYQHWRLGRHTSRLPIESVLSCVLLDAPVPELGGAPIGVNLSSRGQPISFTRVAEHRFEPSNTSFMRLIRLLGPRNFVLVIRALLTEQRILFTSASMSMLTESSTGLTQLLYPLQWEHLFVPVLPLALRDDLRLETPFIIGLHKPPLPDIVAFPLEAARRTPAEAYGCCDDELLAQHGNIHVFSPHADIKSDSSPMPRQKNGIVQTDVSVTARSVASVTSQVRLRAHVAKLINDAADDQVFIVDLDDGRVDVPTAPRMPFPELPQRDELVLLRKLRSIVRETNPDEMDHAFRRRYDITLAEDDNSSSDEEQASFPLNDMPPALPIADSFDTLDGASDSESDLEHDDCDHDQELAIRCAFLEFFVDVISTRYRNYIAVVRPLDSVKTEPSGDTDLSALKRWLGDLGEVRVAFRNSKFIHDRCRGRLYCACGTDTRSAGPTASRHFCKLKRSFLQHFVDTLGFRRFVDRHGPLTLLQRYRQDAFDAGGTGELTPEGAQGKPTPAEIRRRLTAAGIVHERNLFDDACFLRKHVADGNLRHLPNHHRHRNEHPDARFRDRSNERAFETPIPDRPRGWISDRHYREVEDRFPGLDDEWFMRRTDKAPVLPGALDLPPLQLPRLAAIPTTTETSTSFAIIKEHLLESVFAAVGGKTVDDSARHVRAESLKRMLHMEDGRRLLVSVLKSFTEREYQEIDVSGFSMLKAICSVMLLFCSANWDFEPAAILAMDCSGYFYASQNGVPQFLYSGIRALPMWSNLALWDEVFLSRLVTQFATQTLSKDTDAALAAKLSSAILSTIGSTMINMRLSIDLVLEFVDRICERTSVPEDAQARLQAVLKSLHKANEFSEAAARRVEQQQRPLAGQQQPATLSHATLFLKDDKGTKGKRNTFSSRARNLMRPKLSNMEGVDVESEVSPDDSKEKRRFGTFGRRKGKRGAEDAMVQQKLGSVSKATGQNSTVKGFGSMPKELGLVVGSSKGSDGKDSKETNDSNNSKQGSKTSAKTPKNRTRTLADPDAVAGSDIGKEARKGRRPHSSASKHTKKTRHPSKKPVDPPVSQATNDRINLMDALEEFSVQSDREDKSDSLDEDLKLVNPDDEIAEVDDIQQSRVLYAEESDSDSLDEQIELKRLKNITLEARVRGGSVGPAPGAKIAEALKAAKWAQ